MVYAPTRSQKRSNLWRAQMVVTLPVRGYQGNLLLPRGRDRPYKPFIDVHDLVRYIRNSLVCRHFSYQDHRGVGKEWRNLPWQVGNRLAVSRPGGRRGATAPLDRLHPRARACIPLPAWPAPSLPKAGAPWSSRGQLPRLGAKIVLTPPQPPATVARVSCPAVLPNGRPVMLLAVRQREPGGCCVDVSSAASTVKRERSMLAFSTIGKHRLHKSAPLMRGVVGVLILLALVGLGLGPWAGWMRPFLVAFVSVFVSVGAIVFGLTFLVALAFKAIPYLRWRV